MSARPPAFATAPDLTHDVEAAWAALPFVAAAWYLVERFVAAWIPHENPTNAPELFLKELVPLSQPETLEHIRYVLAITSAPIAFAAAFLCLRRLKPGPLVEWMAIAGQATLALVIAYAVYAEEYVYFKPGTFLFAVGMAVMLYVAACRYGASACTKLTHAITCLPPPVAISIAVLVTMAFLSPSVMRDAEVYLRSIVIWEHLEYTAGEYFGIATGKTPFVNFFPQYNSLLPILVAPVFRLAGYTLLNFTTVMVLLSLLGLLSIFFVFVKLTRSSSVALAYYLPILAFGFYGPFSYFAVWPMRYVWPMVCFAVLAWAISKPALWRWGVLGALAGSGAINNLDFGVPALAASVAAIFLSRTQNTIKAVSGFAVGGVASVLFIEIALYARSGQLPDLSQAATFSKIFGAYGFAMLPWPYAGLYWVVCLTYLLCLFVAVISWLRRENDALYAGVLAFIAVFGCGSLMYYVGRSHPHVLLALFVPWAIAAMLLLHGFVSDFQRTWLSRSAYLSAFPGLLLIFHYTFFAAQLGPNVDPVLAQSQWFHRKDAERARGQKGLRSFILRNVAPSTPTVLAFPMGSKIAGKNNLRDVFPFAHPGAIILKAQAEQLQKAITSNGVNKVFVSQAFERDEIHRVFAALGFQLSESFGSVDLWTKPAPAAEAR
ncbi:MAG: hypothetical protein ABR526_07210 [Chthoniobacterales bacterium]